MSDQTYLLILRLLHIGCGIFWAGGVIYFAVFVAPAIKNSGPEGVKFMQELGKTKYPIVIMIAAIITIAAGVLLIWKLSGGFQSAWFSTKYAMVLTTGGGIAIIAFLIGFFVNRPTAARMIRIVNGIAKAGGPPTNQQIQELAALRKTLFTATNYIAILLVFTIVAMSIFRYV